MKVTRIVGFIGGFMLISVLTHGHVTNNDLWFMVGYLLAAIIVMAIENHVSKPKNAAADTSGLNREARRHPNGRTPAQKFKRVSAKGRQKQGNNKAVRGW